MICELKNMLVPKFKGTTGGDAAEAWLVGMNKYFGILELNTNNKAIITIHKLEGDTLMSQDHLGERKKVMT